jgi:hypothetical protein
MKFCCYVAVYRCPRTSMNRIKYSTHRQFQSYVLMCFSELQVNQLMTPDPIEL